MKLRRSAFVVLALATASAAAQTAAGRTREEVLRELAEARRMGELIAPGCGGGTLREAFPHRYPRRNDTLAATQTPEDAAPRAAEASAPDALVQQPGRPPAPDRALR